MLGWIIVVLVVVAGLAYMSVYELDGDKDEAGFKLTLGELKTSPEMLGPGGWHLVIPLIQRLVKVRLDMRTVIVDVGEFWVKAAVETDKESGTETKSSLIKLKAVVRVNYGVGDSDMYETGEVAKDGTKKKEKWHEVLAATYVRKGTPAVVLGILQDTVDDCVRSFLSGKTDEEAMAYQADLRENIIKGLSKVLVEVGIVVYSVNIRELDYASPETSKNRDLLKAAELNKEATKQAADAQAYKIKKEGEATAEVTLATGTSEATVLEKKGEANAKAHAAYGEADAKSLQKKLDKMREALKGATPQEMQYLLTELEQQAHEDYAKKTEKVFLSTGGNQGGLFGSMFAGGMGFKRGMEDEKSKIESEKPTTKVKQAEKKTNEDKEV